MADERIEIEIVLEDGSIAKGFTKLQEQAKKSEKTIGQSLGNAFKNVAKGINPLKIAVAGLGAAFTAAFAGKQFVEAAQVQEDAVNSLNTSLRLAGRFSEEASQSFQDFASALQNTTTVGDEVILQQAALASNFAATNEQAQQLTEAAVELSAATGISLESAITNLGKTTGGLVGELGELVPALRDVDQEALKSGAAIEFVLDRFGGAAAARLQTFSGQIEATSNAFGDLQEVLGSAITSSPTAVRLVNELRESFIELGESISDSLDNRDVVRDSILGLADFGKSVNTFLVVPIEFAFNLIKTAFNGLRVLIQGVVFQLASSASKVVGFFAPDSELAQNLALFAESSGELFDEFSKDAEDATGSIGDFTQSFKFEQSLESIRAFANEATEELKKPIKPAQDLNKTVEQTGLDISQNLKSAAGAAIGSIAILTKSLVSGEAGFAEFGKAILGILGDLAIQIGTQLVLIGTGIDALKKSLLTLTGGLAIAAGLALIAAGGLLKGLSGGAGGLAGTPGAAVDSGLQAGDDPALESVEPEETNNAVFNLTVQGDILDRRESGLAIKEILEDFGAEQGGVVIA